MGSSTMMSSGIAHEGLGDPHPTAHPARDPANAPVPDLGQAHPGHQLAGLPTALGPAVQPLEDAHVVEELQGREAGVGLNMLREVAEHPLDRPATRGVGQVLAVNVH